MSTPRHLNDTQRRNGRIKVVLHLREDLFHLLRRRAEREQTSIGEVAEDFLRARFGG